MVGIKRLAGRVLLLAGLVVSGIIWGLLVSTSTVFAGQGGGQAQPASDNTTLWLVGGLIVVMLVAGIGLFLTRRGK